MATKIFCSHRRKRWRKARSSPPGEGAAIDRRPLSVARNRGPVSGAGLGAVVFDGVFFGPIQIGSACTALSLMKLRASEDPLGSVAWCEVL